MNLTYWKRCYWAHEIGCLFLSEIALGVSMVASCREQSGGLERGATLKKVGVSREKGEEERVWLDDLMLLAFQEMLSCGLPRQC